MFVLPPPPKYPTITTGINGATGLPIHSLDTNNSLAHPSGPEYQLVVGEGTYILRDDLHLGMPPPHPSEAPVQSGNPLATATAPPTSGVKLSLVITSNKKAPPELCHPESANSARLNFTAYNIKESEKESQISHETSSSDGTSLPRPNGMVEKAPAFGASNTLLHPQISAREASKRKKPKGNMVKTSSSFLSRFVPHEALSKRLQDRNPDGIFAFANINRAFQWLDLENKSTFGADHLTKILFTKAHMLCHDVNLATKTSSHIDVITGSSAADIMWYEPFSQRYHRINKNGMINPFPVSDIRWIPGSDNLFLASHMDGTLVVYDKDRDDATFVPEETAPTKSQQRVESNEAASLHVNKSVNSKNQKTNPVAFWKISNQKTTAISFSPDCRHLAVVSDDGSLRIIDYLKEILLDIYTSYYGGLSCVCWSPDGKYVVTGGQDDLVSIWSLQDRQIVARCPGHHSWVTAVAFDPWRCDDRNYRFGSVGEDCRLLLWDFNVSMLHKPKAAQVRPRASISSNTPLARHQTDSQPAARLRSNSSLTTSSTEGDDSVEHPVESRTRTAELPPVMSKVVDPDPLCWIGFQEDSIVTSCNLGHIRTWNRPKDAVHGAGSEMIHISSTISSDHQT